MQRTNSSFLSDQSSYLFSTFYFLMKSTSSSGLAVSPRRLLFQQMCFWNNFYFVFLRQAAVHSYPST